MRYRRRDIGGLADFYLTLAFSLLQTPPVPASRADLREVRVGDVYAARTWRSGW